MIDHYDLVITKRFESAVYIMKNRTIQNTNMNKTTYLFILGSGHVFEIGVRI